MTTPAVHSEDDNFIVGSSLNAERLRRDARQLHLSKHNETRRKAHYARFRNAALKCSMETTYKSVEQERELTIREIERAQAETMKRKESYLKLKETCVKRKDSCGNALSLPSISSQKKESLDEEKATQRSVSFIRENQGSSWMSDGKKLDNPRISCDEKAGENKRNSDGVNSWMSVNCPFSVDDIKKVSLNEPRMKMKPSSSLNIVKHRLSVPSINTDNQSTASDVTINLRNTPNTHHHDYRGDIRSSQSEGRFYRAYSSPNIRIYPEKSRVTRSNSCDVPRVDHERIKHEKIWRDFDGILKWFAEYSGKDYTPLYGTKESDNTKDTHAQTKKTLMPKCAMSPLYFRYGVPEDGVIRLC